MKRIGWIIALAGLWGWIQLGMYVWRSEHQHELRRQPSVHVCDDPACGPYECEWEDQ
jgi:hypothetical protein